jgi:hypothetical protein
VYRRDEPSIEAAVAAGDGSIALVGIVDHTNSVQAGTKEYQRKSDVVVKA